VTVVVREPFILTSGKHTDGEAWGFCAAHHQDKYYYIFEIGSDRIEGAFCDDTNPEEVEGLTDLLLWAYDRKRQERAA
jgi:hypothetical protein